VRHRYLTTGGYGEDTIAPRLFGDPQERRRFIKALIIRLPFEPQCGLSITTYFDSLSLKVALVRSIAGSGRGRFPINEAVRTPF